MICRKIAAVTIAAALALAAAGCVSDNSQANSQNDSQRRSRAPARPSFSFGKKNDAVAQNNNDRNRQQANQDLGNLNPETSMERDLKRLQASETAQLKRVEELRGSLGQRSDLIRREEEKLADIQKRIGDYDTALQRYDMAARARPPREFGGENAVVPEEMFQDRPVQNSRNVALNEAYPAASTARAGDSGLADYHDRMRQLPPRDLYAAAPPADYQRAAHQSGEAKPPRNEFLPPANVTAREIPSTAFTGETMLYRSGEEPQVLGTANYRIGDAGLTPVNSAKPAAKSPAAQKPFAGAPVGRANHPLPTRQEDSRSAKSASPEDEWMPDSNLFSTSKAAPMVQPYPGAGNNPPAPQGGNAGGRNDSFDAPWPENPPPVKVSLPPQGAKAAANPPVAAPAVKKTPAPAPNAADDEVFTPDLFLSRR